MLTIQRTILEGGTAHDSYEVVADIGVHPVRASGDGWHEPREPAYGETHIRKVTLVRTKRGVTTRAIVDVPAWLADLVLEDAQEEADEAAADDLYGEAA